MNRVELDILLRNPGTDASVIVVNPVSWLSGVKTLFNERVELMFPAVAHDCDEQRDIFGDKCRGDVRLTPCTNSHGYIIASIFCITNAGISVDDLLVGLRYLTGRMPTHTYRLPENMGFSSMNNETHAHITSSIGPVLWLNGIATESWFFQERCKADFTLINSDEFAFLKKFWSENLSTSPTTCATLWFAMCIRNGIYVGSDTYNFCLAALCKDIGCSPSSTIPSQDMTVRKFMAKPFAELKDGYNAYNVPNIQDYPDDRDFLFQFIAQANYGRRENRARPYEKRAPYPPQARACCHIIRQLTVMYIHRHNLRQDDPACDAFIQEVVQQINKRPSLYAAIIPKRNFIRFLKADAPN